jgi:biopolymer transport protein TolR
MSLPPRRRRRRKLKAEINVVPYIDVMLVLLIIFMITAPLLNLGVDVELPRSNAKSLQQKSDPVVVQVYEDGSYSITVAGDDQPQLVDAGQLVSRIGAMIAQQPDQQVLVGAVGEAKYQRVIDLMDLLQDARVTKVSLLTNQKARAR